MTFAIFKRGASAIVAAIALVGVLPATASAALIAPGSELGFFGTASPTGGADLATATGLAFPAPADIAVGTGDFAFASGGTATFNSFGFAPAALGTILTFDNGGAFTATSVTIDFQTASALDLTFDGYWSLNGADDTAGSLVLTADNLGGLTVFSAGGSVAAIPVPGALLLFGSALFGLGATRRKA